MSVFCISIDIPLIWYTKLFIQTVLRDINLPSTTSLVTTYQRFHGNTCYYVNNCKSQEDNNARAQGGLSSVWCREIVVRTVVLWLRSYDTFDSVESHIFFFLNILRRNFEILLERVCIYCLLPKWSSAIERPSAHFLITSVVIIMIVSHKIEEIKRSPEPVCKIS